MSWVATGLLLVVALPADPDGVPRGVLAAYLAFLVLAAAHGAYRGLRTPLSWPPRAPLAVLLGLVLLAAPVGGAVAYDGARDEATQKMLLDRLDKADRLVADAKSQPFESVQGDYHSALTAYHDLTAHHAGSRAAKRVPDRLRTFYAAVGTPYDQKKFCDAIAPLKYLRTVPEEFGAKGLGSLAGWPDDRLATSLYECGLPELRSAAADPAPDGGDLGELLTTFPKSAQAAKVEPAVRAAIDQTAAELSGKDPCGATGRLRGLSTKASGLPGEKAGAAAALTADSRRADGYVETGTYACGASQYRGGDFDSALTTMRDFTTKYPHDKNRPIALKVAIAAEIAKEDPDAGKRFPTTASGGSIPVTISNDSPDAVEILYTGPVTGSVTLKGCGSCAKYSSDASARATACTDSGKHYAKKTIHLPPGTTYFLHKPTDESSETPGSNTSTLRNGYIYTECAYVLTSYGF